MTDALAKWAAALNTFDSIKHNFRAPGQVEKALNSIALDERVLLFRGSDSDIVERLSPYDQVEGECCLARACVLSFTELGCVPFCSRIRVTGSDLLVIKADCSLNIPYTYIFAYFTVTGTIQFIQHGCLLSSI